MEERGRVPSEYHLLGDVKPRDVRSSRMNTVPAATIAPARHVRGRVRVPGDKSISHRYALIAALAHDTSRLLNYAPGADCRSTLACLRGLGVPITEVQKDSTSVTIMGRGIGRLGSPAGPLDAGN